MARTHQHKRRRRMVWLPRSARAAAAFAAAVLVIGCAAQVGKPVADFGTAVVKVADAQDNLYDGVANADAGLNAMIRHVNLVCGAKQPPGSTTISDTGRKVRDGILGSLRGYGVALAALANVGTSGDLSQNIQQLDAQLKALAQDKGSIGNFVKSLNLGPNTSDALVMGFQAVGGYLINLAASK